MKKLYYLIVLTVLLLGLVLNGSSQSLLDGVNIGDTTSELGHNLTEWTNIWSGCGWCGPDGNMRLIWGDGGETCATANNWASVTLDAGIENGKALKVVHLDGAADDGFNVYVNDDLVGTYVDQFPSNTWTATDFDISSVHYTGVLTIKFEATAPAWGGCGTYGQVAFDMIELYGGTCQVTIDIKPGSEPNSINLDSNGVVPVAILGSASFDAGTVNPFTVELAGAAVRLKGKSGNAGSLEDVNSDGYLDLVVQVQTSGLTVTGDGDIFLTAYTYDDLAISGSDSIRIVPPE
jgi:hypothetical protein